MAKTPAERIREIRIERGLTLEAVAARANLAPSTLSRLETGRRRLAVDHLAPLARALGVRVDDLVSEPEAPDPRVHGHPRRAGGMIAQPLTRDGPAAGLHAFKLSIPASRTRPEPRTHAGFEWLYVLSGRLRLVLGDHEHVLEPGEAVEFSTWTPHWIGAAGGPAEALAIFGPQGERVHLRGGGAQRP